MSGSPFKGPQQKKTPSTKAAILGAGAFAICLGGVATAELELNTPVKLLQVSDAEALGIDAAYDANHFVLVHTHIVEHFRLAPDRPLVIMLVDRGTSLTQMCDVEYANGLKKIFDMEEDNGFETSRVFIEQAGVVRNPCVKGAIDTLNITAGGTGYAVDDVITATNGDGTAFEAKVSEVDGGGAITAVEITNRGLNFVDTLPSTFSVTGAGSGATFTAAFYSPTLDNGYDDDCRIAITKAQALVDSYFALSVYIDNILVECREFNGTVADSLDFSSLIAPNVLPVVAQDPMIAAKDTAYAKYADVGAALGMEGIRKVSESLGSNDIANKPAAKLANLTYPLTDYATNRWLSANLSGGQKVSELSEADKTALHEKHVCFVGSYEGFPGKFFSDNRTCALQSTDFYRIHHNKVWNKAARIARATLLPKMKGEYTKTPSGDLAPVVINNLEGLVNKALEANMIFSNEMSNFKYVIDPTPDPVSKKVSASLSILENGILDEIDNYISKVTSI